MLRIQSLLTESNAHGPSLRSVLWLSDSSYPSPPSDLNPFVIHFPEHSLTQVSEILQIILASPRIEGVSIFASDVTHQLDGLMKICLALQKRGLGIFLWSPKPFEEMKTGNESGQNLVLLSDVYIEGKHEPDLEGDFLWRTSSNQVVHFITPRYKPWQRVFCSEPEETKKQFQIVPELLKNRLRRVELETMKD